jgi:hypothetical protein
MGLFGETKEIAKIVINCNVFASQQHAIGICTGAIEESMTDLRHIVPFAPRDYPESRKDYDERIKRTYYVPVVKGYLLESAGWSGYKSILFLLPENIKDLPYGMHKDLKDAFTWLILKRNVEETVVDMMHKGIRERDTLLKGAYALEFAKDWKENIERWVDDGMKRFGARELPPPKPNEVNQ